MSEAPSRLDESRQLPDASGEWTDQSPHPLGPVGWTWLIVVVATPGLALAIGALLLFGPSSAAAAILGYGLLAWAWLSAQGRLALRSIGARPPADGEAPRLTHLVSGLAADLGLSPPSVWLVDLPAPNALVCRAGGPALAVDARVPDLFTRTELEALVAHCLLRIDRPGLLRIAVAAGLGPLAGPVAPHVGEYEDSRTAAVTRYPPALASAMAKCSPVSGRFAAMFFVAGGHSHAPRDARFEAVSDL